MRATLHQIPAAEDISKDELRAIATGVSGGIGFSVAPFANISLTWPAKPPQQKRQPSPTPQYDSPHFTEHRSPGSVFAASGGRLMAAYRRSTASRSPASRSMAITVRSLF